jgi:hypothetical protein
MIPQNCIDTFIKKFNYYPSIFEIRVHDDVNEKINSFVDKYNLIWFKSIFKPELNKSIFIERLCEYDPTGILIYQNDSGGLFILTTIDRVNVSEYLINIIKKIK